MNAAAFPRFDPASPDAEILNAFERVRAARAHGYTFDKKPEEEWPSDAEVREIDDNMMADEGAVRGRAFTIAGVAAQVLLEIPSADQARWVDQSLMEHGLMALHGRQESPDGERLDGNARALIDVAYGLVRIEWEQTLAEYERSDRDFRMVLELKGLTDDEEFANRDAGRASCRFHADAAALADKLEGHFGNCAQIERLIRTLAPTFDALGLKSEIAIKEGVQADAHALDRARCRVSRRRQCRS